jgi:hypothetical protein
VSRLGQARLVDDRGWDADLRTEGRTFVVFAGRVFAYEPADAAARAEAEAHGRAHGVPDAQLDWP